MNKSKVIIIAHCGCTALQVAKMAINCGIDVIQSKKNTEDQLKDLGYSYRVIQSLLNMESMDQSKQSFEELNEALKKAKPLIVDEPKSKYINNPRRNYKR